MWTCPKCNTQNMSDAVLCHRCKSDHSGQLRLDQCVLLKRPAGYAFYSLTFAPGEIKYLMADVFVAIEAEERISFFKQLSQTPQIEGPWGGNPDGLDRVEIEKLFGETTWENSFRIHHGFAILYRDFGVL